MSVLETPRLVLRPLTLDDAAFMLALVNEPAWLRFIGDRGVRNLDDARRYLTNGPLAMYARFGFGHCLVERKADGAALGLCGLVKRETLSDVDLGFAFFPRHWGAGYAHEAAVAVLAHGEGALGLSRIVAITAPDNTSSIRLLEKLEFRFERMIRHVEGGPESRLYVRAR
ncbi:MAG: N-acetyltransferase [Opitutus sp.]|nr:N-acetyltransferase [Opitutus sp.]